MLRWKALIFTVLAALMISLGMAASPVAAAMPGQEESVKQVGGNFNRAPCQALGFAFGTKIESPSNGVYVLDQTGGENVTLSIHENNRAFDFVTSDFDIAAVVVKGGPGVRIYRYPGEEDYTGSNLQPPDRTSGGGPIPQPYEISYLAFCYNATGETEPQPSPEPGEGSCGLGFWKNHPESWGAEAYRPEIRLSDVFENVPEELAEKSLMEALRFGGGPGSLGAARLLLRTSVVGLLNASHPAVTFALTDQQVVEQVTAALASNERQPMMALKTYLASLNAKGCPLAGGGYFERPEDPFPGETACMVDFWLEHIDEWWGWFEAGLLFDSPDTKLQDLFDLTPFMVEGVLNLGVEGDTLLAALSFSAGPGEQGAARILLREAVATWLNQSYFGVDYGYEGDLIVAVGIALAQGRPEMLSLAAELHQLNSAECFVLEEEVETEEPEGEGVETRYWILRISAKLNQNLQPIYLPLITTH
jgi:hypothetical protein